ncbi:MAG TPA: MopE-related protein [Polyangiales bacterium]|nr:MopE-related protein [Polyangiales bacterium]
MKSDEVCDGKDNDCDGNADEGVRNDCGGCAMLEDAPGQRCAAGDGECQGSGMFECDGKDKVRCSAAARSTTLEVCDTKDNDCDGRVDEGTLNACNGCGRLDHAPGEPCSAGMGACKGTGVYECEGTDAVSCNASARAPTREVCDGEDNDCNGMIDDGVGKTWYQDCDGDGYAVAGTGMDACSKPAQASGCDWTERAPSASATDCDDRNEVRHPGADFGLPISRTGQTLPPVRDAAYDLNCDGVLETSGELSTGLVVQGQLELIGPCEEQVACQGQKPLCYSSFRLSGETTCGQGYPTQTACSGMKDLYFLCR